MNIPVNKLNRIQKTYEQLIALTRQIEAITTLAQRVASGRHKLSLSIHLQKELKPREQSVDMPQSFDDYIRQQLTGMSFMNPFANQIIRMPQKQENQTTCREVHEFEFTDSECLRLLDAFIKIRQQERLRLLEKLKELGVDI